jgi:hypothetical protein
MREEQSDMDMPVINTMNSGRKASKRGKVFGYSRDTHLRYEAALKAFFAAKPNGRLYDLSLVLTTTQRDPASAKEDLRYWRGGMLHTFDCHGVYGMEFNDYNFVHYNVVLRFVGKNASTPVETIVKRAKELWARRGYDHPKAFDFSVVWGADGLRRYMLKSDHEKDGEHVEKHCQKRLPDWLNERGTGCTWWGYIGRERGQTRTAVEQFPGHVPAAESTVAA